MPSRKRSAAVPLDRVGARLEQVLGFQLARAAVHTTAVFQRTVGEPLGLRPVEFTILALIDEVEGVTPARLARSLAMSAPNVTAWLDKLDARGLVERRTNRDDRRVQLLTATAEGRRVVRDATQRLVDGEGSTLAGLSRGERLLLNELLCKVAALAGLDADAAAAQDAGAAR